jgi:hypothetical protein
MVNTLNRDLFVYEGKAGQANNYSDALHIKNAKLNSSHVLNPYITYMFGKSGDYQNKNFPLLYALEGQGKKKGITSTDLTYTMDVYGKPKYTTAVSKAISQPNAGKNGASFKLIVKDRIFWRNMVVSTGGTSKQLIARILDDGERTSGGYIFKAQLSGVPSAATVPSFALAVGNQWGRGVTKVGLKNSHGTRQMGAPSPFRLKNQLSVIRHSYTVSGNVASKKVIIPFKASGKTIEFWSDWDYMHNELTALVERNDDLLFSVYNADALNNISDVDSDTGEVVPSGAGAWQQITNELTYSFLSEKMIDEFIHDLFYNADPREAQGTSGDYVIMGGVGLMKMFDQAMRESSRGFLQLRDSDFIRKSSTGSGLQYGNYFTEYKHWSGKIIKLVHEPAFDVGPRAEAAERHPLYPNMSIMSFSGLALDFSLVEADGNLESNITLTYEEGREYFEGTVQGLAKMPGAKEIAKYISTDVDQSSIHKLYTQGVHLYKPLTCGKFNCVIS